jgi:hypothetical protein
MVCHDMMLDFYQAGAVSDAEMRDFERGCFVKTPKAALKSPSKRELSPVLATAVSI